MCGIAGILGIQSSAFAPARAEIEAMLARLHHRGPDGTGMLLDGPMGLGHARLAIIDVAGGQQPIFNEDRTVAVVFNGEIFNYVELRGELEGRGHRFATRSDTEVLVHLYEDHGERFVEHLNGQFAIALWDARKRHLVLARDRTGIRPLFHAEAGGRFVFASEVKALFALPAVRRGLDRRALAEICTYWSPLPPRTAFEEVSSLPAGHLMVVRADGDRRVERYWDWTFPEEAPRRCSEGEYVEELRALLADAVRLQLRSDVPVGTYLSGGLDSAVTTALARAATTAELRTFSLTFDDPEFDESAQQRSLVDFLGTRHTSIAVRAGDIAAAFPRAIAHAETPIVRTAPAPLMLLAAHVRAAGFKVVLTGEGADEVFGGYDLFKEARVRRFWARAPQSRCRPRLLERLDPWLRNSPATGRAFTEAFFRDGIEASARPWFAHVPRWTTTRRIERFFSAEQRAAGAFDPFAALEATLPRGIERWIALGRDQYVEAHTLMTGYLLCSQGDRMAMAHSVEGRFPFLDHRVIEFASHLPPQLKIHGLNEKYLLKKAAAGLLPPAVRARTKQPSRAPDSASFFAQGRAAPYVDELFSPAKIAAAGFFDPAAAGRLLAKCRSGGAIGFADNMAFVAILSTMLLHEQLVLGNEIDSGDALAERVAA